MDNLDKLEHDSSRTAGVLRRLEERSNAERSELEALNARGADFVREAASEFLLDAGPDVGALLNALVRVMGARTIVEIGSSSGYSTLWLAEAARETDGRVIAFEPDPRKFVELQSNLRDAGLGAVVDPVKADAHTALDRAGARFDLVFIDHWKADYIRAFDAVWPRVCAGGVVIADNILEPEATRGIMREYVRHVGRTRAARSRTLALGQGIEMTIRSPASPRQDSAP